MKIVIRQASEADIPTIEHIVYEAYKAYISRIGMPPAPMTDDYHQHVASANAWVLSLNNEVVGILVLLPKPGHMLLDNVAIIPARQGSGLGCRLIEFAETTARMRGYEEIRLYTNELMHENLALYKKLGYQETSRKLDSGFNRVFMKKIL